MANEETNNDSSPFDVHRIRRLVSLMSQHDLSEIDLREGEMRIRLRRGARGVAIATTPAPVPIAAAPQPAPVAPSAPKPAESAAPGKPLVTIKSPTPGTFYIAPSPGAEPFVQVGSRVNASTVVCIIEAMKIYNEIPAECSGVITAVLVEDKQPVEYGQALFQVDPTA